MLVPPHKTTLPARWVVFISPEESLSDGKNLSRSETALLKQGGACAHFSFPIMPHTTLNQQGYPRSCSS